MTLTPVPNSGRTTLWDRRATEELEQVRLFSQFSLMQAIVPGSRITGRVDFARFYFAQITITSG